MSSHDEPRPSSQKKKQPKSRGVIRLGDYTTCGGRVITASARMTIDGIPVALWGDHCSCPLTEPQHANDQCGGDPEARCDNICHGSLNDRYNGIVICEGDIKAVYDDRPVALEGHKTNCGATLITSAHARCRMKPIIRNSVQPPVTGHGVTGAGGSTRKVEDVFDEQVQLTDFATGQPLAGAKYKIVTGSGKTHTGVTDANGKTMRVSTTGQEQLHVYLLR